jgi:hypothetical protein
LPLWPWLLAHCQATQGSPQAPFQCYEGLVHNLWSPRREDYFWWWSSVLWWPKIGVIHISRDRSREHLYYLPVKDHENICTTTDLYHYGFVNTTDLYHYGFVPLDSPLKIRKCYTSVPTKKTRGDLLKIQGSGQMGWLAFAVLLE